MSCTDEIHKRLCGACDAHASHASLSSQRSICIYSLFATNGINLSLVYSDVECIRRESERETGGEREGERRRDESEFMIIAFEIR